MQSPDWQCLRCEKNLFGLPYELIEIFEDERCLRPLFKRVCLKCETEIQQEMEDWEPDGD
jgi:hypothetical protein